MCGIFGIASTKSTRNKLYQGLMKLEYRGYDSSGISGSDISSKLTSLRETLLVKDKNKFSYAINKLLSS